MTETQLAYHRAWYKKHAVKRRLHANKRWAEDTAYRQARLDDHNRNRYKRVLLVNRLKNKPCIDCQGWFHPVQMHFDHRDPKLKLFDIGTAVSEVRPIRVIFEEIAKCDLVCANCHALRTYKQIQNNTIGKKRYFNEC